MPLAKNSILSRVSPVDLEDLRPYLQLVELPQQKVLAESRERINQVYFPHEGIISCVVELVDGWSIETGMIGNDGVFGGVQALNNKVSLHKVMVQAPGWATIVDADRLKAVAQSSPDLLSLLLKYEQFLMGQVQQTTACNAIHKIEQRMCKWLVRMYDLAGSDLPLTQEFAAQMMGVRRTSVTEIATQLQKEGLIAYSRGRIKILNIERLQHRACECHDAVRDQYVHLFGTIERAMSPVSSEERPRL